MTFLVSRQIGVNIESYQLRSPSVCPFHTYTEEFASVEFVPLQAGSASSSVRNAVRSRLDHSRPDERGNVAAGARRNFFIVFSPSSSSSTSFFFECVV